MSSYKLVYFNSKARAEAIRLMFYLSDTEYEDCRIDYSNWQLYKLNTPFGQLPVLEIDGESLTQVKGIARLVAKETGFYGTTAVECAFIDEVMDVCEDWHGPLHDLFHDETMGQNLLLKRLRESTNRVCRNLETILTRNKAKGNLKYFVGKRMTVADLYVFCDLEFVSIFVDNMLQDFPDLLAFKERTAQDEAVAEWLQKRPKTQY